MTSNEGGNRGSHWIKFYWQDDYYLKIKNIICVYVHNLSGETTQAWSIWSVKRLIRQKDRRQTGVKRATETVSWYYKSMLLFWLCVHASHFKKSLSVVFQITFYNFSRVFKLWKYRKYCRLQKAQKEEIMSSTSRTIKFSTLLFH